MTIYGEIEDLYEELKKIEDENHKFTNERIIIGALLAVCEELRRIRTELHNRL